MARGVSTCLRSFERFAAIVVLIALPTCMVFAQTSAATATILGVVKDTTGALIPGVSITVKHTETGQTRTAISSETGDYNVPLLPQSAPMSSPQQCRVSIKTCAAGSISWSVSRR